MRTRSRKRSSCDSGSGKVPAKSCGFCVAMTKNGIGQRNGLAVERDLPLVHGLEQGRLGARAGAVDLVGEENVRENGPLAQNELARVAGRRR